MKPNIFQEEPIVRLSNPGAEEIPSTEPGPGTLYQFNEFSYSRPSIDEDTLDSMAIVAHSPSFQFLRDED